MCVCVCVCVRILKQGYSESKFLQYFCNMRHNSVAAIAFDERELLVVLGGARDIMVIVVGNGHDDKSLSPGRDW